jgi:hypothetical protein
MKEYRHKADCKPKELPGEALMALNGGSLEDSLVSAVPPCRVMNPHEIDLEDSGIFYELEKFLGLKPNDALIKKLPAEVAIYVVIGENPDELHSLRPYNW